MVLDLGNNCYTDGNASYAGPHPAAETRKGMTCCKGNHMQGPLEGQRLFSRNRCSELLGVVSRRRLTSDGP